MWNQGQNSYQGYQSYTNYGANGSCNQNARVVINTDGHCAYNGRIGAVAGIGVFWGPNDRRNVSRPLDGRQTNNRAEIVACSTALQQCREFGFNYVKIRTDSTYVIDGINKWIQGWKCNGWRNYDGAPVENKEDWERLDWLQQRLDVQFEWVKGHSGDYGNDQADRLARNGATGRRG